MIRRFTAILLSLLSGSAALAQNSPVGTWEGLLKVGVELRIVFHIRAEENGFVAVSDSPDQSVYDIPCDSVVFSNDSLRIYMHALQAKYEGVMVNDTLISGFLTQGLPFPLDLKKTDRVSKLNRPQVPQPPFPYREENLSYYNRDKSIRFGATLTLPEGKGPHPAVVLISGSGAQDRNSTLLGHPLFHVLADHLTRNGFAVLRFDERGVGETGGVFSGATSEDFADDVEAAVDYLLSRHEVDRSRLGLIGHSEGGMIAPMVANRRKEISYLVLLAAPGVPNIELMAAQNEAIARSAGVSGKAADLIPVLFRSVAGLIIASDNLEDAKTKTRNFLSEWIKDKDAAVLTQLKLENEEKREEYVKGMTEQLQSPWLRFFVSYDPTSSLQKLSGKVLALNGTRDLQVVHSQNLPGIESALKKSRVTRFSVKELEGLNHLFQQCKDCTLQEYGILEETFSPVALETISGWLNKEIKKQP